VIGFDRCPMGVRTFGEREWSSDQLYKEAARRLKRWEAWCRRAKHQHPPTTHYNPGNPVYADQVRAFEAALEGKQPPPGLKLTARTREILRRMRLALDGTWRRKQPAQAMDSSRHLIDAWPQLHQPHLTRIPPPETQAAPASASQASPEAQR
jgi:hypothetical protein